MIELVQRDVILPVRHRVLRPGMPLETAYFPEDDDPEIFHLAALTDDGVAIGCATFFPQPFEGRDHSWQLRGMATVEEHQGQGIGGQLLAAGVAEVTRRGGERVWCNGRTGAAAFYRRNGFHSVGDVFVLKPHNLEHYVFLRELRPVD